MFLLVIMLAVVYVAFSAFMDTRFESVVTNVAIVLLIVFSIFVWNRLKKKFL
jgi:hypothetical protein